MVLSTTPGHDWLGPGVAICILGVLTHLAIFIRGEWHMQAPLLVWIYFSLFLVLYSTIHYIGADINTSLKITSLVTSSYATGLFLSIGIYRKYFHRLRNFPGPWAAGVTKFWHVWQCRNGRNYLVIEQLRQEYGPVIRTGPAEITIINSATPLAVDGPGSQCTKAVWYDFLLPEIAINTTRNRRDHDSRRRIWDRGFSTKALTVYQQRVLEYAKTLAARIEELARRGDPVNVTDWFYWFTFDVMGEFAFARSFNMLQDEQWHRAVKLLRKAMSLLGPFSPVPWLAQIAFHITPWMIIVRDWLAMMEWCKQRMGERIELQSQTKFQRPDVSHWLIDASVKGGSLKADREWLNGDAVTIIIAGSDTIAPTLVFAFYELARNPLQQDNILHELRNVDIYDRGQLQRCAHLNAVINETLRLHPPVPTGGYRQSPPGGLTIDGIYIPGNVTIVAPRYSLARLESSYENASQWIPERWTTRPEMIRDARGFAPFSQGRFNCVGKTLAMNEMRIVIALLIQKFQVELSGHEKGEKLFADLKDQFTAAPGKLELKFHIRE